MSYNRGMGRRAAGALFFVGPLVSGLFVSLWWPTGAAATPLPDPSEPWIKVRTAHFTLFSNASEKSTAEIGLDLERFRAALSRLVSGLEVNSPLPTSIYVFKHDASFQPYKMRVGLGPANISGAFAAHRDGNYVGINATPPTDPWSVIYHEYVHYFLNNNYTDIPLWFNEGAAECFSTFRAAAGKVEIGRPIDDHVGHLKSGKWIPLPDLFAIDVDSKDYNEGERQGTFYAESWALVHFLAWGRPDAKARGVDFLAQFRPRTGLKDALRPIVGPDWSDLETRLVAYVRRARFTYSILDLKDLEVDPPGPPTPMTYAETLSRLGDYLLHSQSGRAEDAQAHYQAAIQADPSYAPAYAGMGYLRDVQKRQADAAGYYERALALAPDDALTLFLYAESLVERFSPSGSIVRIRATGPTPKELARARDLYRRSIRLRPEVAEAYAGLGATFTLDDDNLAEGIEALEKARVMLPSRLDVVLNLAGLYARSGERAKARDLVERVLLRSGDRRTIETGQEILLEANLKTAETLINKGELEAGVEIIREVQGKTRDAALRRQLDDQLRHIEEVQTLNRQIEAYNRAVALANAGNYRKAAAILERLVGEVKDPGLARNAQDLLKRARQGIAAGPGR